MKLTFVGFTISYSAFAMEFNFSDIEYQAQIGTTLKQFEIDTDVENNEYQISLKTKFQSDWEQDFLRIHFGFFNRYDPDDDSRNIFDFDEAYVKTTFGNWSMSAGNHIFNWSVLEIFHPVDNINAKNLEANGELTERLGQRSIIISKEFEASLLEFIVLLETKHSIFPGQHNRSGPQYALGSPKFVTGDYELEESPDMAQGGIRYIHNFDTVDFDFHILRRFDNNNNIFSIPKPANTSPGISDLDLVPYYFPVTQLGVAVQGTWEEYIYKIEVINLDYDNYDIEFFVPHVVIPRTILDHQLFAAGLEHSKSYENDTEGTYFIEYQTILGTTIEEARGINVFQRDMSIGYRHNFNDFNGNTTTVAIVSDIDHGREHIFNFSHKLIFKEVWEFNAAVRIIEAPESTKFNEITDINDIDPTSLEGLKPLRESDNIFIELTRLF